MSFADNVVFDKTTTVEVNPEDFGLNEDVIESEDTNNRRLVN